MAWGGYYEFNGVEIINASRTEAYAKAAGAGWFKAAWNNSDLGPVLGQHYDSPLQDDAPWTDPDNLDTYDFWGVYPLDVTGIEDTTISAPVTESTLSGGMVGSPRLGTRTVVFNTILVGLNEQAVLAGMDWLKAALGGGPCSGTSDASCMGGVLCFLSAEPCVDWETCDVPEACADRYMRSMHRIAAIAGPSVIGKHVMTDGGVAWMVGWTMVAGNPFKYSSEKPLVTGFLKNQYPYAEEVPDGTPPPQVVGRVFTEAKCNTPTFQPIQDPYCPQVELPPSVPQNEAISLSCFPADINYKRRSFVIPETYVPLWGEVVPYIEIHADKAEVRNLRLRFYADVLTENNPNKDPCAYCGDVVFSYIPKGAIMVFDGIEETVYVKRRGQRLRADAVVYGSDGGPFEWPQLTCGYQYVATWDLPQSQDKTLPSIDLSLYGRTA